MTKLRNTEQVHCFMDVAQVLLPQQTMKQPVIPTCCMAGYFTPALTGLSPAAC